MSFTCDPKKFVLHVKELAMSAMAGVSNGVDAVSEDLRVTEIDTGGGRYGRGQGDAVRHKNLYHQ